MVVVVPTARPGRLGVCYWPCPRRVRGGSAYVTPRAHGSSGAGRRVLLVVPTAGP